MAYRLYVDGRKEPFRPADGKEFTLAELQSCVKGPNDPGYIELVHLNNGEKMIVNEEGIRLELPLNPSATLLYNGGQYNPLGMKRPPIVGDVLICHAEGDKLVE